MNKSYRKNKYLNRIDYVLLAIVGLLFITSIIAINASAPYLQAHLSANKLIIQQVIWYVLGLLAIGILFYFGNDTVFHIIKIIYFILLIMLILLLVDRFIISTLFYGRHLPFISDVNGAWAWYNFPGIGSFQPSEFMKIVLIIICAKEISEHNSSKNTTSFSNDLSLFKKIAKWCLLPIILIFLQPDTGIVIIIAISIIFMLIAGGIKKEWIILGGLIALIGVIIFFTIFFLFPDVLGGASNGGYRLSRFYGWIYPEEYIEYGRQLYTALLNLGTAGWFGVGSNVGTTILEAQTDFIFAVFGRTYGFIGALWIIGLCIALDTRLYQIYQQANKSIDKYMIAGVLAILFFQQIQNIGMIIGLLPITGITLPFISYGGSSILSYLVMLGIILNISSTRSNSSKYEAK